jgi:GrpB-like predicted nucleotidyltransferase (UPF0157 family)
LGATFRCPCHGTASRPRSAGHPEIRKLLLFRDHLRRNARDSRRYEAAKRELATRQWRDMNYYAAAKGPVIAEILRNAGWTATLE